MKTASIFIPGSFEDAYLYMGRLVAVTERQSLRFYNIYRLITALEDTQPAAIPLLTWVFLRNDWLASEQFKSLMRNADLARVFWSLFGRLPTPLTCKGADASLELEEDLGLNAKVVLDMRLYNRRIYLGADNGLFHRDYDWAEEVVEPVGGITKRLDTRCINMSARFGALNASCGDDGLFTSLDDFRWTPQNRHPDLKKLADKSLRTAWLEYDLVNYSSYSEPALFRGQREDAPEGVYGEKKILVTLGDEVLPLTSFYGELHEEFHVSPEIIQYSFNSNNVLFVQTIYGHLYTIGIKRSRQDSLEVRFTRDYDYQGGRILGTQFSRYGTIIEADNGVTLFAQGNWIQLFDGEVLSVRAFAGSKRYQNIVCLVKEDGILLIALVDEAEFAP